MNRSEQFLADIEAFLERTGISATAFGKQALSDPNFVGDLRDGRTPNLRSVDRVHDFMASYKVDANE